MSVVPPAAALRSNELARRANNKQEDNMNKIVTTFFTLALITIFAYAQVTSQQPAQPKCSGLTKDNAPFVRGVGLGMKTEELLALFPGSNKRKEFKEALERVKAATFDETVYLLFDPATDASGDRFAGVDSVSVGLNKGRVVDFYLLYVGTTWRTIDEWIAKLAERLSLPGAQEWVVGPNETPNKILRCRGLEIEATIHGGGGSIRLRNTEILDGTEDRTNTAEEIKRRGFKP